MRGTYRPEPCALCGAALRKPFTRWHCYTGGTWAVEGYWAMCPECSERMRRLLNRERKRHKNEPEALDGLV